MNILPFLTLPGILRASFLWKHFQRLQGAGRLGLNIPQQRFFCHLFVIGLPYYLDCKL